jgi:hypothetical protein
MIAVACGEEWDPDTGPHLENRTFSASKTDQLTMAALPPAGVFAAELGSVPVTSAYQAKCASQDRLRLSLWQLQQNRPKGRQRFQFTGDEAWPRLRQILNRDKRQRAPGNSCGTKLFGVGQELGWR